MNTRIRTLITITLALLAFSSTARPSGFPVVDVAHIASNKTAQVIDYAQQVLHEANQQTQILKQVEQIQQLYEQIEQLYDQIA